MPSPVLVPVHLTRKMKETTAWLSKDRFLFWLVIFVGQKLFGLLLKVAVWGFSSRFSQPVGRPTCINLHLLSGFHGGWGPMTTVFAWEVLQLDFRKHSLAQVNWALACSSQTSTCVPDKNQPFQEALNVSAQVFSWLSLSLVMCACACTHV